MDLSSCRMSALIERMYEAGIPQDQVDVCFEAASPKQAAIRLLQGVAVTQQDSTAGSQSTVPPVVVSPAPAVAHTVVAQPGPVGGSLTRTPGSAGAGAASSPAPSPVPAVADPSATLGPAAAWLQRLSSSISELEAEVMTSPPKLSTPTASPAQSPSVARVVAISTLTPTAHGVAVATPESFPLGSLANRISLAAATPSPRSARKFRPPPPLAAARTASASASAAVAVAVARRPPPPPPRSSSPTKQWLSELAAPHPRQATEAVGEHTTQKRQRERRRPPPPPPPATPRLNAEEEAAAQRQLQLEKRRAAEIARLRMENRRLREQQAAAVTVGNAGSDALAGGNGGSGSPVASPSRRSVAASSPPVGRIREGDTASSSPGDSEHSVAGAKGGAIGRRQIEAYTSRHFEWEKKRTAKLLAKRYAKQQAEEEKVQHDCKQFVVKKRVGASPARRSSTGSGSGGGGIEGRLLAWAEGKQQRRLAKKRQLQEEEKKALQGQRATLYKNRTKPAATAGGNIASLHDRGMEWRQKAEAEWRKKRDELAEKEVEDVTGTPKINKNAAQLAAAVPKRTVTDLDAHQKQYDEARREKAAQRYQPLPPPPVETVETGRVAGKQARGAFSRSAQLAGEVAAPAAGRSPAASATATVGGSSDADSGADGGITTTIPTREVAKGLLRTKPVSIPRGNGSGSGTKPSDSGKSADTASCETEPKPEPEPEPELLLSPATALLAAASATPFHIREESAEDAVLRRETELVAKVEADLANQAKFDRFEQLARLAAADDEGGAHSGSGDGEDSPSEKGGGGSLQLQAANPLSASDRQLAAAAAAGIDDAEKGEEAAAQAEADVERRGRPATVVDAIADAFVELFMDACGLHEDAAMAAADELIDMGVGSAEDLTHLADSDLQALGLNIVQMRKLGVALDRILDEQDAAAAEEQEEQHRFGHGPGEEDDDDGEYFPSPVSTIPEGSDEGEYTDDDYSPGGLRLPTRIVHQPRHERDFTEDEEEQDDEADQRRREMEGGDDERSGSFMATEMTAGEVVLFPPGKPLGLKVMSNPDWGDPACGGVRSVFAAAVEGFNPLPDGSPSPAMAADGRVQPGDFIVTVGGEPTAGEDYETVISWIQEAHADPSGPLELTFCDPELLLRQVAAEIDRSAGYNDHDDEGMDGERYDDGYDDEILPTVAESAEEDEEDEEQEPQSNTVPPKSQQDLATPQQPQPSPPPTVAATEPEPPSPMTELRALLGEDAGGADGAGGSTSAEKTGSPKGWEAELEGILGDKFRGVSNHDPFTEEHADGMAADTEYERFLSDGGKIDESDGDITAQLQQQQSQQENDLAARLEQQLAAAFGDSSDGGATPATSASSAEVADTSATGETLVGAGTV